MRKAVCGGSRISVTGRRAVKSATTIKVTVREAAPDKHAGNG